MQLSLTDTSQYLNLTSLSYTGSLVVTNHTSNALFFVVQSAKPSTGSVGILCKEGEEVLINNPTSTNIWVKASYAGNIEVQRAQGASAEYSVVAFPQSYMTSTTEGLARLRVDDSQTSFFLGTQARSFAYGTLAAGASIYFKVVAPVDTVQYSVEFHVDGGTASLSTFANPVLSGVWGTTLPVIRKNTMAGTPAYTPQVSITSGGTATGTLIDYFRITTSSATAQQTTVGGMPYAERGVPAGTYVYKVTNEGNGSVFYQLSSWWEERP